MDWSDCKLNLIPDIVDQQARLMSIRFFFSSRRRHTRFDCDWSSDVCSSDLTLGFVLDRTGHHVDALAAMRRAVSLEPDNWRHYFRLSYVSWGEERLRAARRTLTDRKSTRLNSSHSQTSYAVFCLKKRRATGL